jgi:hypothetical protein
MNRLEKKHGIHEHRCTRSVIVGVDSRYPKDRLNQFIAEHGFDDPDCLLFVISFVTTDDADPITGPYVMEESASV